MQPPQQPPAKLFAEFTMHGKARLRYMYSDQTVAKPTQYTQALVNEYALKAAQRKTLYYGTTDTWLYQALAKYPIAGKSVLIIGSVTPWYEAICLEFGGKPTVLEYNKIQCEDKRITYALPSQLKGTFDCCFCISSVEHDGLGRYGDPINPAGDIEFMKRLKKLIKPDGTVFLAVPIGIDTLTWNACRIYGEHRLPLLLKEWKLIAAIGYVPQYLHKDRGQNSTYQPIFVLSNAMPVANERMLHAPRPFGRVAYARDFALTVLRKNPIRLLANRLRQ